jgi:hypothetical protein
MLVTGFKFRVSGFLCVMLLNFLIKYHGLTRCDAWVKRG